MSSGWTRLTSGKIKGQRTLTLDGAKFTPEFQDDSDTDVDQHREVTPQSSFESEVNILIAAAVPFGNATIIYDM